MLAADWDTGLVYGNHPADKSNSSMKKVCQKSTCVADPDCLPASLMPPLACVQRTSLSFTDRAVERSLGPA